MPRKVKYPNLMTLFDLMDEQERHVPEPEPNPADPRVCPHATTKDGWRHQTTPGLPYFGEYVHSDPACLRPTHPGSGVVLPSRLRWSVELQRDVLTEPECLCEFEVRICPIHGEEPYLAQEE